jgi:hypothetical protein
LAGELAAISSREHAGDSVVPVIDIYNAPAWAVHFLGGCDSNISDFHAQPLTTAGLAGYKTLIADILALGRSEKIALPYFAPWNEPNSSAFLSPQHLHCNGLSVSYATGAYAQLAEAMEQVLASTTPRPQMLLGEFMNVSHSTPETTSIADFIAQTPESVLCASSIWSVHDYADWGASPSVSAVALLENALDARGGCGASASIWVTETGAGAAHAGSQLSSNPADGRAACRALAANLTSYFQNPRVTAVIQYSFREDTLFPVGLINATLSRLYPSYYLWLAWSQRLAAHVLTPPPLPSVCAS